MEEKIPFEKIRTIFFDYDGTLHNSIRIYAPAFRKAYAYLVQNGYAEERKFSDLEISRWLGYSPPDMWKEFMPQVEEDTRRKCSSIIGEEMSALTEKGYAKLYEGAQETLEYLHEKGYRLVFLSNCKIYYRDTHKEIFRLGDNFEDLVCSEEYDFIPKHEILKQIKPRYEEEMLIVGDRNQDMEAGMKNDIHTIGCSYGFSLENELSDADLVIDDIRDLKKYL